MLVLRLLCVQYCSSDEISQDQFVSYQEEFVYSSSPRSNLSLAYFDNFADSTGSLNNIVDKLADFTLEFIK